VTTTTNPARSEAQRKAIAHARREQAARRAVLVAQVDAAIAAVGWEQARPCVVAVLGPNVPVSGPRGRWRGLLRVRSTRRLLAMLDALPAQQHLALSVLSPPPHPPTTLTTSEVLP